MIYDLWYVILCIFYIVLDIRTNRKPLFSNFVEIFAIFVMVKAVMI